jgi:hypothetical protein
MAAEDSGRYNTNRENCRVVDLCDTSNIDVCIRGNPACRLRTGR